MTDAGQYHRSDGDSSPRYNRDSVARSDEDRAVAAAIASYISVPDASVVRPAIRKWLGGASVQQLPPEKMLIRFKDFLREVGGLPPERIIKHEDRSRELILMCIEEYYSAR